MALRKRDLRKSNKRKSTKKSLRRSTRKSKKRRSTRRNKRTKFNHKNKRNKKLKGGSDLKKMNDNLKRVALERPLEGTKEERDTHRLTNFKQLFIEFLASGIELVGIERLKDFCEKCTGLTLNSLPNKGKQNLGIFADEDNIYKVVGLANLEDEKLDNYLNEWYYSIIAFEQELSPEPIELRACKFKGRIYLIYKYKKLIPFEELKWEDSTEEQIESNKRSLYDSQKVGILNSLVSLKIDHNDLHRDNFVYDPEMSTLKIIDWASSSEKENDDNMEDLTAD